VRRWTGEKGRWVLPIWKTASDGKGEKKNKKRGAGRVQRSLDDVYLSEYFVYCVVLDTVVGCSKYPVGIYHNGKVISLRPREA
jgi:hypothetical protein